MKSRQIILALSLLALPGLALAQGPGAVPPTTTTTAASSTVSADAAKFQVKAKARADQEIDRRIKNLNTILARIDEMKRVSEADKATLRTTILTEVTNLTNLKAKIAAGTDLATLKADIQSITKTHRLYALLAQKLHIIASADRVVTIAGEMSTLEVKFAMRIASSTGDMTAIIATDTDLKAKIADAEAQAAAAVAAVVVLVPDDGDKTALNANEAALKDARSKIQAASKALSAARKDINTIQKALRKMNEKKDGEKTASTTKENNKGE